MADADHRTAPASETREGSDLSLALFIVLSRAYNAVNRHVLADIRSHGLNPTEFAVVELLFNKGRQPLQQIGEKILISSGNITYVVDKLEEKGYLARKPCAEDRRVIYAELTDAGRAFMEAAFPPHIEVIHRAVGAMTDEEKRDTIRLLKKLGLGADERWG